MREPEVCSDEVETPLAVTAILRQLIPPGIHRPAEKQPKSWILLAWLLTAGLALGLAVLQATPIAVVVLPSLGFIALVYAGTCRKKKKPRS